MSDIRCFRGRFYRDPYLDDGPKAIALTIDDGPDPRFTPAVLKILADHGVTAT